MLRQLLNSSVTPHDVIIDTSQYTDTVVIDCGQAGLAKADYLEAHADRVELLVRLDTSIDILTWNATLRLHNGHQGVIDGSTGLVEEHQ